jgi:hypothetical protein
VFDVARQLNCAGDTFDSLMIETSEKGEQLADVALAKETSPSSKLVILEYLARREYYDTRNCVALLARWDRIEVPVMSDFRRGGGSAWYCYLSLVFRAMIAEDREKEAIKLATDVLNGNRESSEGYVILGGAYAGFLLGRGEYLAAMACFEWMARECPMHRVVGTAHYWLALRSFITGDQTTATSSATAARECFAGRPEVISEWEAECKSYLLLKQMGLPATPLNYEKKLIQAMAEQLEFEIQELS